MSRGDRVDVDAFLAEPLVARIATDGPTVRPVWFLWECATFWWLTDTGTALARRLPGPVAVVVDMCDVATGRVVGVTLRGVATVEPLDVSLAHRKFARYLGPDPARWDPALLGSLDLPTTRLGRLVPSRVVGRDRSYSVGR